MSKMRVGTLLLLLAAATATFGCDSSSNNFARDAAVDLAVFPQVTHVGKSAVTTSMVTAGSSYVLYLADPIPGRVDFRGHEKPSTGELHIADRHGADYTLGKNVTADGY